LREPLWGAESLLFAASFKKTMKSMGRMPDGSEMQAVWLYTSPIIIRNMTCCDVFITVETTNSDHFAVSSKYN